jgi:hypothetical protein
VRSADWREGDSLHPAFETGSVPLALDTSERFIMQVARSPVTSTAAALRSPNGFAALGDLVE